MGVLVLGGRAGGELAFAVMTPRGQNSDALIADCQAWIADNYACANPVARMMGRTGLKLRTFGRRFRTATGYEPISYVHAIRIEEAKQMLETSTESVEEIAHAVGYEDPASFRRLFKR